MSKVPLHYIPKYLSKKSKQKAKKELQRSRTAYKKKKYYTRKKIPGYKSKKSKWSGRVKRLYKLESFCESIPLLSNSITFSGVKP